MDNQMVRHLISNAVDFAKAYAEVKEALVKSGVADDEARTQAQSAAWMATAYPMYKDKGAYCPVCQRGAEQP